MRSFRAVLTFDDNSMENLKVAALLNRYGIRGVFFLVAGGANEEFVRELGKDHEVASHTYSHSNLIRLDDGAALRELASSKAELERSTGKRVHSLAYPFGSFNMRIASLAAKAGYEFARTCRVESPFERVGNPFALPLALTDAPLTRGGNMLGTSKSLVRFDKLGIDMFQAYYRSEGANPYRRILEVVRTLGRLGGGANGRTIISMMHPELIDRCDAYETLEEIINEITSIAQVTTLDCLRGDGPTISNTNSLGISYF